MAKKINRSDRRKFRIRAKIKDEGYRLSIFRSNKYLFAQIIDCSSGKSVFGFFDKKFMNEQTVKMTKTEKAKAFGKKFAKEAVDRKIKEVVFDRGSYLYHGRVKAFAEGVREGGLQF